MHLMRLERTSFAKRLGSYAEATELAGAPILEGRLLRMVGLTLEAEGLRAAMGSRCMVINDDSYHPVQVEAEVMGFSGSKVFLMPVGSVAGIAPGARVVPLADTGRLPMGMSMLGRVLDGAGRALDGKGGMKAAQARTDQRAAGRGHPLHQRHVDGRPWPAARAVCRYRCR
jgi:flagellum-specific ATP synthase